LDTSFWTYLVAQVAQQEPAARHAVVAISSLYEHFGNDGQLKKLRNSQEFALKHYNSAIKHVLMLSTHNIDTILLVSVLFVCMEFLRGNADAAINHLEHGVNVLLSSSASNPILSAVYHHLSIFPSFFSQGSIPGFPLLHHQLNHQFQNLSEAQVTMDWLSSRVIRLVRTADPYRLGTVSTPVPQSLTAEQQLLSSDLDSYALAATKVWKTQRIEDLCSLLLKIRWHVCKIWVSMCFAPDERIYDEHIGTFKRIVDLAARARESPGLDMMRRAKFTFQMGFCPLLHFVVMKCRNLRLRLAALALQAQLSCSQEVLWDVAITNAIGRRMIEIEHAIELNCKQGVEVEILKDVPQDEPNPPDNQRIRDSVLDEETRVVTDEDGKEIVMRKIRFFVPKEEGGIGILHDWVKLQ